MPLDGIVASSAVLTRDALAWESAPRAGHTSAERGAFTRFARANDPGEPGAFRCTAPSSAACSAAR